MLHKLIQGGEQWLSFALSKVRSLEKLGLKYVTQQYKMPDDADVTVRIVGDQQFVKISEGSDPRYEFFVSEAFGAGVELVDGNPISVIVGSGVAVTITGGKAKPVFSNIFPPDEENPKWWKPNRAWLDFYKTGPENIVDNPKFFKTWASWQQQKMREYVWWPNNGSSSLVTSTQSLPNARLSTCGWYGIGGPPSGEDAATDTGFDIPPTIYDKKGAQSGAPVLEADVWWRRAAVQKVKSEEYGDRSFFVMTDTHGRFYVYPVKAYQKILPGATDYLFLPPEQFKRVKPDYPAWAYIPEFGADVPTLQAHEFVWTFNKDATKAVTALTHSEPLYLIFRRYHGEGELLTVTRTLERAVTDLGRSTVIIKPENDEPTWYGALDDTPGLFEVGIEITITGKEEMDFTVVLNTLASTFYGTDTVAGDQRYYVDAGYLLKNKRLGDKAEEVLGAPEDALLTAEIEIWGNPRRLSQTETLPDDPYPFNPDVTDESGAYYSAHGIHAYYVVRAYSTQKELRRVLLSKSVGIAGVQISTEWFENQVYDPTQKHNRNFIKFADLRSLSFNVFGLISTRSGVGVWSPERYNVNTWITSDQVVAGPVGLKIHDVSDEDSEVSELTNFNDFHPVTCEPPTVSDTFVKHPHHSGDRNVAKVLMQAAANKFVGGGSKTGDFNVHPDGHWACGGGSWADPKGVSDIIQMYKGEVPAKRTSHKEMFNKAFTQTRDYSFYGSGIFPDENIGSMQMTGIWVTF